MQSCNYITQNFYTCVDSCSLYNNQDTVYSTPKNTAMLSFAVKPSSTQNSCLILICLSHQFCLFQNVIKQKYSSLSFETEFFYHQNAFEISVIVCINSLSLFIAVIRVCLSIFTQRHLDRCLFESIMNKYIINIHAQVFIFGQKFLFLQDKYLGVVLLLYMVSESLTSRKTAEIFSRVIVLFFIFTRNV